MARRAEEPFVLARVGTNIALACLASGGARQIGAEYGRGVHDDPPGCVGKHCQEKYVWTPVSFTISLHHGLVWSYPFQCCWFFLDTIHARKSVIDFLSMSDRGAVAALP